MKEYKVEIGGIEHTLQLSDEDAKARGLTASKASDASAKASVPAANKARTAANKAE